MVSGSGGLLFGETARGGVWPDVLTAATIPLLVWAVAMPWLGIPLR